MIRLTLHSPSHVLARMLPQAHRASQQSLHGAVLLRGPFLQMRRLGVNSKWPSWTSPGRGSAPRALCPSEKEAQSSPAWTLPQARSVGKEPHPLPWNVLLTPLSLFRVPLDHHLLGGPARLPHPKLVPWLHSTLLKSPEHRPQC